MSPFLPILMLTCFAISSATVILVLHEFLSVKTQTQVKPTKKTAPYECGVPPVGNARTRFHVRFFMVALLFLLFDVEAIFLYLWGPLFYHLGWFGMIEMVAFLVVIVLGLAYAWGKGALEAQ